jgi:hypothetical protein
MRLTDPDRRRCITTRRTSGISADIAGVGRRAAPTDNP